MPINVSVQYNDGLLPGIILLTQCYYHTQGNPFKCHEEVSYLQPTIPPILYVLTFFPLLEDAQKV